MRMMPKRNLTEDDPLDDFERRSITLLDVTEVVYVAGTGPAVIVMTEMPGISPCRSLQPLGSRRGFT